MKIIAVDFGDSRTGLAMCDKTEMLASPLCVVPALYHLDGGKYTHKQYI